MSDDYLTIQFFINTYKGSGTKRLRHLAKLLGYELDQLLGFDTLTTHEYLILKGLEESNLYLHKNKA